MEYVLKVLYDFQLQLAFVCALSDISETRHPAAGWDFNDLLEGRCGHGMFVRGLIWGLTVLHYSG